VFVLDFDPELLFVGDAGTTERVVPAAGSASNGPTVQGSAVDVADFDSPAPAPASPT
jgi:hypothetical protein